MLRRRLPDARSGRVIFVSHCLLNQNVRYLGGACHPGTVDALVDQWRAAGDGICQMPCPEQVAWGGVLKRAIVPAFGANTRWFWRFRRPLLALFAMRTRWRYRRLARSVAAQVRDYRQSGFDVVGVVGVAGSPSCGVRTTLDVRGWLETVSRIPPEQATPDLVNQEAVAANAMPGQGWFTEALARHLEGHGAPVEWSEHDLSKEVDDEHDH